MRLRIIAVFTEHARAGGHYYERYFVIGAVCFADKKSNKREYIATK